ncbi:MAG: transporter substrate-binding domain-containing protein [Burkholderiaceae bacterium]|nr:MAG: transporter substrate-binding domain-containing protein [Burkholderiaceae bacterium]
MQMLAKEVGEAIDVRYIVSCARVQEEARQGRIDLVAGAFYTLPRLDYMDYLHPPFQQTRSVIWTTQSYNLDYMKWADLKGLQGVTVINNSFCEDFDKFAKQSLKISTVASLDQAFVMLEKGRAQYLIYEDQPGWAHVGQKKITGMKALKAPVSNEELYLTVSQMSSCNVGDLRGKLSKALYKLKKDDVMTKLLDKHQQIWRQQNTAP